MHQLVKSMVNWNIYNDNIMTSGVAQLKNSRSSLQPLLIKPNVILKEIKIELPEVPI